MTKQLIEHLDTVLAEKDHHHEKYHGLLERCRDALVMNGKFLDCYSDLIEEATFEAFKACAERCRKQAAEIDALKAKK